MFLNIEWTPSMETGIEVIDQHHHDLIDYLAALDRAIETGNEAQAQLSLRQLLDFSTAHNDYEEDLLDQAGYPLLDAHRKQHQAFRVRVHGWTLQMARDQEPLETARHIRADLAIWMQNHILHEDQAYLPWVRKHLHPGLLERLRGHLFRRHSSRTGTHPIQ